MSFRLKGVWESLSEENEEFFKTYYICYIKTENTRFSRVRKYRHSRETYWSFCEKPLVAKKSWDSRNSLCINLKIFSFCLKTFREKSLVAKYSRGSSETFCMKMWPFNFPQAHFSGSSKSWASREKTSEPILKKNTKMHFEQKLNTRKYKITLKNK